MLWLELYGLYRGLCLAIQYGYKRLHITMDSRVGVDIILSKCNIPWRTLCLTKKISSLFATLDEYERTHVWRGANQSAYILASLTTGYDEVILYPTKFPTILKDAILRDAFNVYILDCNFFFVIYKIIYLPKK